MTLQLIWPAASTLGSLLHTSVSFCALLLSDKLLSPLDTPPIFANDVWHAGELWQMLHPNPPQPDSQEQPELVKFAKDVVFPCTRSLLDPWKMSPPHGGCEQDGPPKPGGQLQVVPFWTP